MTWAGDEHGWFRRLRRLSAGGRVAGYRLDGLIGRGGMAVVFRAFDEVLNRQVAVKILAPALAADEEFRQRFIRESRSAAMVDDPHIIPIFAAGEADGALYIAMRYVPTGDVGSLVRREGPLPPARAAAVIAAAASALDSAHDAGLVHRDVKPANMLIDLRPGRPDHVYLADFGLAKSAAAATSLTGTDHFLGTLDYCAPEQIQGQPVDGRVDQYALACSAFTILAGTPPFTREDRLAVLHAQLANPPARSPGGLPARDTRRAGKHGHGGEPGIGAAGVGGQGGHRIAAVRLASRGELTAVEQPGDRVVGSLAQGEQLRRPRLFSRASRLSPPQRSPPSRCRPQQRYWMHGPAAWLVRRAQAGPGHSAGPVNTPAPGGPPGRGRAEW